MSQKKSKVSELIEKLKDELDMEKMVNLKYLEQNFYMNRELKLYEKNKKEKDGEEDKT